VVGSGSGRIDAAPIRSPARRPEREGHLHLHRDGHGRGNGKVPSGQASADETKFSGCGGFSLLSVQVKDVNLPDGSVLWVTLDFKPVGTISLRGGSGTMATYNMGRFGVSNDDVRVYSALPDISSSQQILIGGAFR
jgi:hypothetical protein